MLKLKTLLCGVLFTYIFSTTIFAATEPVSFKIESHDRTLFNGTVAGETLQDALTNITNSADVTVLYKKNNDETIISSINDIENNFFGENDGWHIYIERNGQILTGQYMLNTTLLNNDKVVVYYGDADNTKIIENPTLTIEDKTLNFAFDYKDFSPSGIKIHVETPKKTQKILISDETGVLTSKVNDLGYYSFYAEYYNYSSYPKIVKTDNTSFFIGPVDDSKVTRGEAVDFIINHLSLSANYGENVFSDTQTDDFYYQEAIVAYNNDIVKGYADKTFQGDNPITLSELCIILARANNQSNFKATDYNTNAPLWAKDSVNYCIDLGIFTADEDFSRFVTIDDLHKINY